MLLKSFPSEEARRRFTAAYPMKRLAQPREIANVVAFLVSDEPRSSPARCWRLMAVSLRIPARRLG